jgi:hypothetical protein
MMSIFLTNAREKGLFENEDYVVDDDHRATSTHNNNQPVAREF